MLSASRFARRSARLLRQSVAIAAIPFIAASGQANPLAIPTTPRDSAIRITLVTMGVGSQLYELFGHNALWVQDPALKIDVVFNWGVFDFNSPGFIPRFLLGDMRYTMAGETMQNTMAIYAYLNRHMVAQELNLTPAEKREIVDYIRWNSLPENRPYKYDYYLDNCSTRVRDIIDRATRGQFRAYLKSIQTDETFRGHTLRLMQNDKALVTGVDMILGHPADVKLTADQSVFLPVELMKHIRDFKVDGTRPIVAREYVLYESRRGPEPDHVPALWKGLVPLGLALGGLILLLGLKVQRRGWVVTAVAVIAGLIGILGTIVTGMGTLTAHIAMHSNENMLLLNPIWLVVAVAVPMYLARGRAAQVAKWSALSLAFLGLCAVLIHLIGMSRQPNWDIIGLLLPSQLAIWSLVRRQAVVARSEGH